MHGILRTVSRSRTLATLLPRPATSFGRPHAYRTLVTKRYTKDHEVVSYDDSTGLGTISITEHAQSVLGDVVFVELPQIGTKLAQGETIGAVESVKAASDIYAPVSGEVIEINEDLDSHPGLLNKDAEKKGWLCKIKLSDPSEVENLLTWEVYEAEHAH